MPLEYTEAVWQSLYEVQGPNGDIASYSRSLYDSLGEQWMENRKNMIGAVTNANVLVVGSGFGWLCEWLIDSGVSSAVGVDSSPYIHANKATEARSDITIVDAVVGVDDVKAVLRSAGFPQVYDAVVDEDAASSHTDAELGAFLDGCEALLKGGQTGRIVHLVTPLKDNPQSPLINWKTMAEWKALRPSHTWVDLTTGVVA